MQFSVAVEISARVPKGFVGSAGDYIIFLLQRFAVGAATPHLWFSVSAHLPRSLKDDVRPGVETLHGSTLILAGLQKAAASRVVGLARIDQHFLEE